MKFLHQTALVAVLFSMASPAYSDGLADLKQALQRLQGKAPLSVILASKIENKDMDDNIKNGQVEVLLTDGSSGLQVTYSNQVLQNLEQESLQRIKDEDAQTPTINALNRLDTSDYRNMISATFSLERRISQSQFVSEEAIEYYGQQARKLIFDVPMESLIRSKSARGYVDDFEGKFEVIIAADGTPMESSIEYKGEGSAYLVINVDAFGKNTSKYSVVQDRLVTIEYTEHNGIDSTFGDSATSITNSLKMADNPQQAANTAKPSVNTAGY